MSRFSVAARVAGAFLLGSLPLGHWLLKRRGQDSRLNSAYNLGVENVVQRVGLPVALGSAALDLAKGAASVTLLRPRRPEEAILVGVAGYLGHLNPPKSFYAPRGRGNLVLLGMFAGLSATRQLPVSVTTLPLLAYAVTLAGSRYVSAATLAGLLTFDALVSASPLSKEAKMASKVLLLSAAWRFKENIGRVLDGTEPRLGEHVPLAGKDPDEVLAAFMIHPLNIDDFYQTPRFRWLRYVVETGLISQEQVFELATHFRPMKIAELRGIQTASGKRVRMYLLSSPLMPEMFKTRPELATERAIQGARLAQELGAEVFGLGAFWSVVGNKGLDVQAAVPDLTITNGGAYTSGTIKAAIPGILAHFEKEGRDLSQAVAAVVGANGVVAFGIARTIAPQVRKVIMLGRDLERLDRSAQTLRRANPTTEIVTTTDYAALRGAELVFTATSDPDPVIFPEHISPGTWIFDEGRPADVDEAVRDIAGVRVIPGGVVRPPGSMTTSLDLHFGEGAVPACLAETLILAATGEHQRKSLGQQTKLENINFFVEEAQKLGFEVVD